MPNIDTLIQDLKAVILSGQVKVPDPELVYQEFGTRMAQFLKAEVEGWGTKRPFTLRMSNLGKNDCQLWYEAKGYSKHEEMSADALLKFAYGDIIEELMLSLCQLAGHSVERRQETVEVDGVKGHLDAVIDGEVVDVKSCSSYSFEKFQDGSFKTDDPFGYIHQISGYGTALGKSVGYFLPVDKTLGHITLAKVDKLQDTHARIQHIKEVLAKDTPPPNDCSIKEEKNGNKYLAPPCSYCAYKHHCHKNLRTFVYSTGPRFFTHVESEPRVMEKEK